MARFRCYQCRPKRPLGCEFEADAPVCPQCGAAEPAVLELVDVHFCAPDPRGPFTHHESGERFAIGCQPKREHMAAHELDQFAATGDPRAVTCPSCKGLPSWREAVLALKLGTVATQRLLAKE